MLKQSPPRAVKAVALRTWALSACTQGTPYFVFQKPFSCKRLQVVFLSLVGNPAQNTHGIRSLRPCTPYCDPTINSFPLPRAGMEGEMVCVGVCGRGERQSKSSRHVPMHRRIVLDKRQTSRKPLPLLLVSPGCQCHAQAKSTGMSKMLGGLPFSLAARSITYYHYQCRNLDGRRLGWQGNET